MCSRQVIIVAVVGSFADGNANIFANVKTTLSDSISSQDWPNLIFEWVVGLSFILFL
jgi:hypothetical protein